MASSREVIGAAESSRTRRRGQSRQYPYGGVLPVPQVLQKV